MHVTKKSKCPLGYPMVIFILRMFAGAVLFNPFLNSSSADECVADICFVLDNSGSIRDSDPPGGNNWQLILDFVKALVNTLNIATDATRVAVVDFGNFAKVDFNLNDFASKSSILSAVDRISYLGENTNTTGGLRVARQQVFTNVSQNRPTSSSSSTSRDQSNVQRVLILITDGVPTYDVDRLPQELADIKTLGIRIMAVGVTTKVNESLLREIVTQPSSENYVYYANFDSLQQVDNLLRLNKTTTCYIVPTFSAGPTVMLTTTPLWQTPKSADYSGCPIDLCFVVDNSGSIRDNDPPGGNNWKLVLNFIKALVNVLHIGPDATRVAFVDFGNSGRLGFNLSACSNKTEVQSAVDCVEYLGENTNTTGGLRVARQQVFNDVILRPSVQRVIVLITDGIPTYDVDKLPGEVAAVKADGIRLMAVGVTNKINETLLREIVTQPSTDNYVYVYNFDSLNAIVSMLINKTCVSSLSPTSTPPSLITLLPVVLECRSPADVVFMLDSSYTIDVPYFDDMKTFVSNVVLQLDVDSGKVRVGLLTYSDRPIAVFNLSRYNSRPDVIDGVKSTTYNFGMTKNLAGAFQLAIYSMFSSEAGNRPNVPDMIVLLTGVGSSANAQLTQKLASAAREAGIHVTAVAIGNWFNVFEIDNVVSQPYQVNAIAIDQFDQLRNTTSAAAYALYDIICSNGNPCDSNPCLNSGSCQTGNQFYSCSCPSVIPPLTGINCDAVCRSKVDLVIAMDASAVVGSVGLQTVLNFVRNLVASLNIGHGSNHLAVLSYSDSVDFLFRFNNTFSSYNDLSNALSTYYAGNGYRNVSAVLTAIRTAFLDGGRVDSLRIGLLITSGWSTMESPKVNLEARLSRDANITLVAVGMGADSCNPTTGWLSAVVSWPFGSNCFNVSDWGQLNGLSARLADTLCNNADECISSPCQNGGTCNDVIGGYACACRQGYSGTFCERVVSQYALIGSHGTQFSAVVYGNGDLPPYVAFNFSTYQTTQDVAHAVKNLPFYGGPSRLSKALDVVKEMFSAAYGGRSGVPRQALVFWDGLAKADFDLVIQRAIEIRQFGVHVIAIGIGTLVDRFGLAIIASKPTADNTFVVPSVNNLSSIRDNVTMSTCYGPDMCSSGPCVNGATCTSAYGVYFCKCPANYSGVNCERPCPVRLDMAIVIDQSGSVDETVVLFARQAVINLPISLDGVRVAVVTFSALADVRFYLNNYTTPGDVLNAIDFQYPDGPTNIADALRVVQSDLFSVANGDRPTVANVAVVVSDGQATVQTNLTSELAKVARQYGIEIYFVTVGSDLNFDLINAVASFPIESHVITGLVTSSDVVSTAAQLASKLCL